MELDEPLDAAEAAAASEQLRAIARLLCVSAAGSQQQQQAAPLLATLTQQLTGTLQSLPESFFAPLLPPGSLSAEQVTGPRTLWEDTGVLHMVQAMHECIMTYEQHQHWVMRR